MNEPVNASEFVLFGQILSYLQTPRIAPAAQYSEQLMKMANQLKICGLPNAKNIADSIVGLAVPLDPVMGGIPNAACQQFELALVPVKKAIDHESKSQKMIALDTEGVSEKLRSLPLQMTLTVAQLNLHQETVRCIESGAYRSAIVIGWNLAFDCVRNWVFTNHQAAFRWAWTSSRQIVAGHGE